MGALRARPPPGAGCPPAIPQGVDQDALDLQAVPGLPAHHFGGAPEGHSSGKGGAPVGSRPIPAPRGRRRWACGGPAPRRRACAGAAARRAQRQRPRGHRARRGALAGRAHAGASPRSAAGRRPPLRRAPSTPARSARPASPPASGSRAGAFHPHLPRGTAPPPGEGPLPRAVAGVAGHPPSIRGHQGPGRPVPDQPQIGHRHLRVVPGAVCTGPRTSLGLGALARANRHRGQARLRPVLPLRQGAMTEGDPARVREPVEPQHLHRPPGEAAAQGGRGATRKGIRCRWA